MNVAAAEKIDGINKIVIQDKNGSIRLSTFDEDWNRVSRGKKYKKGTTGFASSEEQFQVDLDGDGELGSSIRQLTRKEILNYRLIHMDLVG